MPLDELLILVGVLGVGGWLLNPIAKAFAERLRGGRTADAELQALREDVVGELQQVRRELADLGERVDFAERMLAQRSGPEALPRG